MLLSFPALVLAILITTLVDRILFTISVTLGLLAIAPVGRLARATTIQFSEREFVVAARTLGATNRRIIVRELLPNVVIPMGALALLGMAVAIVAEGALAFLGLSIEKGESWGKLILFGAESSRVLNEGLDVPDADVAVIVGGALGEREHVQRVGRLLRPGPGKRALVYELVTRQTVEVSQAWRRRQGLAVRRSAQL